MHVYFFYNSYLLHVKEHTKLTTKEAKTHMGGSTEHKTHKTTKHKKHKTPTDDVWHFKHDKLVELPCPTNHDLKMNRSVIINSWISRFYLYVFLSIFWTVKKLTFCSGSRSDYTNISAALEINHFLFALNPPKLMQANPNFALLPSVFSLKIVQQNLSIPASLYLN